METNTKLNTGASMPLVGLGTWKGKPGQIETAIKAALEGGYKHIDCAAVYGNEPEIGTALKEVFASGAAKREDVFITSKLWNTKHAKEDVRPACEQTLKDLGLGYLDLYLIHWPIAFEAGGPNMPKNDDGTMRYAETHYVETWKAMEKLVDDGLVKAIGISNFNSKQVQEIIDNARIQPAVNQVESHPYLPNSKLIEFCQTKNIVVTAYSPLGSPDRPWAKEGEPTLLEDPKLKAIAEKHKKSVAQVCIRFQVQRGVVVIPKSVSPSRIQENFDVFNFSLDEEDLKVIGAFDRNWRACIPKIEVDGKMVPRDGKNPLFPFHEEF